MSIDLQHARQLLQRFDLPKLFVEELGWEHCREKLTLRVGETDYALTTVAEKRGFKAWLCESPGGGLPNHATRLKLDRKLSETSFEHLIVFVTRDRLQQSWMWVRREVGKPLAARSHEYHSSQPGDSLLQKLQGLYVSLEEEEVGLSTVDIAGRARAAFDIERVTKAFYSEFDAHRKAFLKFIDGIGEVADREWYASVMLNRLMFIYFIQKKGFLDGDHNYLRIRLARCKKEHGKDKFYSFYRYFLLRLFHEGFGKRRKERTPDLEKLLGNIPYLNGGLFDVHELEKPEHYGNDIQIPDNAFERIFDYFDKYQWHLDERPLRNDDEINPDVLGYIFEKYINQKQMGAYYTKEDITEYISKNTVLPFLFDATRTKCSVAFENHDGPTVWELLSENPDRYIYPAVRHGITWHYLSNHSSKGEPLAAPRELPEEIAIGLDTSHPDLIQRRKAWNKIAPSEYALPTEIWREVIARRQHYTEVRGKLAAGNVRDINDFITLNLDLRQFTQDVIQNCEGPDLLMAFWQATTTITVLDPTGGSGAFIFAALNILEPLYEGCLDRMEAFLAEWGESGKRLHPSYHKKFTEVLARVDAHPNRRYFVLKSIILSNLYAVDIMEEAVEICKLRLFLKLAAQVEPDAGRENLGIEPLPDIDFNIRAGNTLIGYATEEEVRRCMKRGDKGQARIMLDEAASSFDRFNMRCADVEIAFSKFRKLQTEGDGTVPAGDKIELQKKLFELEDDLNSHLASEYAINVSDKVAYAKWLKSNQPFHWFIQFYGILKSGGFDVIIGNPPYLDLKQLVGYVPRNYLTLPTKNLFSLVLERCEHIVKGRQGYIVPISSTATEGYSELQRILKKRNLWFASFDDRPAHLFDGLDKNTLSILILSEKHKMCTMVSSRLNRWYTEERDQLFPKLQFHSTPSCKLPGCFPRISSEIEFQIWCKLFNRLERMDSAYSKTGKSKTYYSRKVNSFLQILDFIPSVKDGQGQLRPPSEFKEMIFTLPSHAASAFCVFNSTLFRWFIDIVSDGSHLNRRETDQFPFDPRKATKILVEFVELGRLLSTGLQDHSFERVMNYKHDTLTVQCIVPKFSKRTMDKVDTLLADHYGLTADELDFIVNYDIKYRLGRGAGEEEC